MKSLPSSVPTWRARRESCVPDFSIEQNSKHIIIGFDEAGRGPIAGPVVAACVYAPPDIQNMTFLTNVNDSKKLSKVLRERLFDQITGNCHYGIGQASPREIDDINILQASFLAMNRAFEQLNQKPQKSIALIDGNRVPAGTAPLRIRSRS